MTKEQELFIAIGKSLVDSVESKLFGKACFKVHGKAFICFFQNEMVFKLNGEVHSQALNLEGAHLFDPSGKKRPMKEWVQVPYKHQEKWTIFAEEALKYVR
ncbi:MAG: hypothetical protein MI974_19545 [Chitinophagales bacterium]|nr:hypothetical protein [Chitinophagales bacterium]